MTTTNRTPASVLAEAADAAGRAPSVHNTQPWRWRVHADRLDLFADRDRQLQAVDPDGRLLLISCGAALHHARVALAAEGWEAEIDRMPAAEPAEASSAAEPRPLARIRLGKHTGVTPEAMRTFQATHTRHTDRRPASDQPVPIADLAAVRGAVEREEVSLHVLPADRLAELVVAAGRAEEVEQAEPERRTEIAYWVGGPEPGTGMPAAVIPSERLHEDLPTRDFGRTGTLPADAADKPAATYAVMFGPRDDPAGWLRAGEALSAAWLTATDRGVALVPFSAVVEAAAPRAILRRVLAGLGYPYLVVRLGMVDPDHATPPHPPRLESAQTVEIVESDAGGEDGSTARR